MSLFGIINVNKSKGLTSHDVVSRLRKILNLKQIGHTGTLDPLATGVLPVCIGKATKLIQYLETSKSYRAFIKLGEKTDTFDLEGNVTEKNKVVFNSDEIEKTLLSFKGEIVQKPPIYSAVHYKGKRLYEYARKNIELTDIPERKVFISSIKYIDCLEKESDNPIIIVDIDCSTGTYIRSIANDIGLILGYGAFLYSLERTKSGKFLLKDSFSLEEIKENSKMDDIIINPLNILNLNKYFIDEKLLLNLKNGQYINVEDNDIFKEDENISIVFNTKLVAIAKFKENKLFPKNVFL